jgi:hypothetical protein
MFGEHGFRMKLHTFYRPGFMAYAHYFASFSPRGYFQGIREAFPLNDKRMIAGGGKRVRQPTKYARTRVKNGRGFTMHDLFRMDDLAAESLTYTLMAEANAQYGNLGIT